MNRGDILPFTIARQGAVRVNAASVLWASDAVALVYVDLHSKRAVLAMTGGGEQGPVAYLEADADTLHVDETQPRDSLTEIVFHTLPGWSVWAAFGPGRYTLSLTLVAPSVME